MKGYAKKQARRYLKDGWLRRGAKVSDIDGGDDWTETEILPTEDKVRRAILRLARQNGWDGCHWDNPLHIVAAREETEDET